MAWVAIGVLCAQTKSFVYNLQIMYMSINRKYLSLSTTTFTAADNVNRIANFPHFG